MSLADWANGLTIFQVGLIIYKQWITAAGRIRLMYWLMIWGGGLGFISHSMMVIIEPRIWGLLSTLLLMLWSVLMGIKGLWRLNREVKPKVKPEVEPQTNKG